MWFVIGLLVGVIGVGAAAYFYKPVGEWLRDQLASRWPRPQESEGGSGQSS